MKHSSIKLVKDEGAGRADDRSEAGRRPFGFARGMGVVFKVSGGEHRRAFAVVEHPIEPGPARAALVCNLVPPRPRERGKT
jgi:hypothetical protein